MERRTALAVLGLTGEVDLALLKRRFRTLARDHHPDLGGDPATFQDLHTAYEVLRAALAEAPGRAVPDVARGRPSRADDAHDAARRLDAVTLDAATAMLAQRLTTRGECCYLSRAPGARTNRLAGSLAIGTTSRLAVTLRPSAGATAPAVTHIELSGRGRGARRALTTLDVGRIDGAAWSRRRGDALTVIEARVSGADVAAVAHRAAAATARLLDALDWPLCQWRAD